jgi:hypothetical protein
MQNLRLLYNREEPGKSLVIIEGRRVWIQSDLLEKGQLNK